MELRRLTTRALLPLVSAGLLLTAVPSAHAGSAPGNDNFSSSTILASSGSSAGTDLWATGEAGEPEILGRPVVASLWYSFTPLHTGRISLSTKGSDFDTLLAAYTGPSVNALTLVAANDDATFDTIATHQSRIGFNAIAGTTYHVKIDSYNSQTIGNYALSWTSNDDFAAAEPIAGIWNGNGAVLHGTTDGATRQTGEPTITGTGGIASVWFRWTAPFTGTGNFDTYYSDFDTTLAVYTGNALNSLKLIGSNDDNGPYTDQSRVRFAATKGTTYLIALDGVPNSDSEGKGDYQLSYSEGVTAGVSGSAVTEGNSGTKSLPFTFTLSSASPTTQSLSYTTSDGSALAGKDYTAQTGTVTFAPGQTSRTVNVQVKGDTVKEADETVQLQFDIVGASSAEYGTFTTTGTIKNDD